MFLTAPAAKLKRQLKVFVIQSLILLCLSVSICTGETVQDYSSDGTANAASVPSPSLFTGAFSHKIPINVPSGRKGIQPKVDLSYQSSNDNGILGVGWQLELGTIERSTRNGIDYDSVTGENKYLFRTAEGIYDLVQVNGEFRVKIEQDFIRFRKITNGSNGDYWEVTAKNGVRSYFGRSSASRLEDPANSTRIAKWYLDQVEDTNGNYMDLSYKPKDSTHQVYLDRIAYTGNGSIAPANYVQFYYEARTDAPIMYTTNFAVSTKLRLSTIDIGAMVNSSATRIGTYKLNYTDADGNPYSPATGRSLLASVQQYGSDTVLNTQGNVTSGSSLPPVTLEYQSAAGLWQAATAETPVYQPPQPFRYNWGTAQPQCFAGDFNGNGKSDFACTGGGSVWELFSPLTGTLTSSPRTGPTPRSMPVTKNCLTGDFNGDGMTDIICYNGNGNWTLSLSSANGWQSPVNLSGLNVDDGLSNPISFKCLTGDFDGDGKTDIACYLDSGASGWRMALSSSWSNTKLNEQFWGGPYPEAYNWRYRVDRSCVTGDFNGDGKTDIACNHGNTTWYVVLSKPEGIGWQSPTQTWTGINPGLPISHGCRVGDFNGDGKSDVVCYTGTNAWTVSLSKGNGWDILPHWGGFRLPTDCDNSRLQIGDFNGDGKPDLACPTIIGWYGNSEPATWSFMMSTGYSWLGQSATTPIPSLHCVAGDFDGNGKTDMACMDDSCGWSGYVLGVLMNTSPPPDLLSSISNGLGSRVDISFKSSTEYQNTKLPLPVNTVSAITVCDNYNSAAGSCAGNSSTTNYSYSGGYFYIPEKDFRGFSYAKVTDPTGPNGEQIVSETWFHQGNGDINDPNVKTGYMKGKPYLKRVSDGHGNKISEVSTIYSPTPVFDTAPFFTPPKTVTVSSFDAGQLSRETQAVYTFENTYGNLLEEEQHGAANDPTNDLTTKKIVRAYMQDSTNWLVGLPTSETVYQGTGSTVTVAAKTYHYDDLTDCNAAPGAGTAKGNLTRIESLLYWDGDGITTYPETRMAYDPYGNLKCSRDANQNISSISYDASNSFPITSTSPPTIVYPAGLQTTTSYYGVNGVPADKGLYGQIKSVTDPNGATITTEYDVFGRKKRIIDPLTAGLANGKVSYSYQNLGTVGQQKVVTTQTVETTGCAVGAGYTYNSSTGKCEAAPTCAKGSYNASLKACVSTDSYAATKTTVNFSVPAYYFSSGGYITSVPQTYVCDSEGSVCSNVTNPLVGYFSTSSFADSKTIYKGNNNGGDYNFYNISQYCPEGCYPPFAIAGYGNVKSFSGAVPIYVYDIFFSKNSQSCSYDDIGNYNCVNLPLAGYLSPTSGNRDIYSCPSGATLSGTTCTATTNSTPPCPFNASTGKCEMPSQTTIWQEDYFNGNGKTIKLRSQGPSNKVIVAETRYDSRGKAQKISFPYFEGQESPRWITYTYDPQGRVLSAVNPDNTRKLNCYNNSGVTVSIDQNNHRKRQTTDSLGRLVKVEEYTGAYSSCSTDAISPYAETTYLYDVMGNLKQLTDAQGNQTLISYDTLGRKRSMSDPDMGTWTYRYDNNGNLISQTDAKNQTINFSYDALNRVKLKDYPTGVDVAFTHDETSSPNAKGRLTTMTDESGTTKYFYDILGRSVQTQKIVNGATYNISTTFDVLDRTTSIKYPDNETVGYTFDTGGNLVQAGMYALYSGYNAIGQPGAVTFGNGVTTAYQYNSASNRLKNITTAKGAQALINLNYSFDNVGNVNGIGNILDTTRSQTFQYDELDRIKQAQSTAYGTLSYTYDKIGNLTNKGGSVFTFPTNHVRPHDISTANGVNYSYDNNGNLINDGQRTIDFNHDNKPSSINGGAVTFKYDGSGARVQKISQYRTTVYIGNLYECTSGCDKHIFAGNDRTVLKTATQTYYYHPDHLGSTTVVTDATGNKIEAISYKPFGETNTDTGTVNLNYKYAGQELDTETGLYNNDARLYDSATGRFISPDSIVPDPTNPQTLNRYSYTTNNPLKYTDPSGHGNFFADFWQKICEALEEYSNRQNNQQYGGQPSSSNNNQQYDDRDSSIAYLVSYYPTGDMYGILNLSINNYQADNSSRSFASEFDSHFSNYDRMIESRTGGGMSGGSSSVAAIGQSIVSSEPFIRFGEFIGASQLNAALTGYDFRGNEFSGFGRFGQFGIALMSAPVSPGKTGTNAAVGAVEKMEALTVAKNMKILTNGEIKMLKNAGEDIHAIKGRGNVSQYDLYKDKSGNIFKFLKGGKGAGDPTGLNINNF